MSNLSGYLLSIIIPAYNNVNFIGETLASLQVGITDEVELIIIDDGSTDGTGEVITQYLQQNPGSHIKYFYQENSGVALSRNKGLEHATGKYIGFVDSDDSVSPVYFDVLLPILREEQYHIIDFNLTRDVKKLVTRNNHIPTDTIILKDQQMLALMPIFRAAQWHLVTKIFHRNIIGNDRFEAHRRYEDMIFCPFQYFKCEKILKIKCALYYYRLNSRSITENLIVDDARHMFFAMNKMCDYICEHPEKRTIATLMVVNSFLEGRKILRKTKGYYGYDTDMLNVINKALACFDSRMVSRKVFFKMKFTTIDSNLSYTRHRLSKVYKNFWATRN